MYQPPMVNFPVFSVAWGEATDDDGNTKPAALTAGGGGAGNTGVGNKIVSVCALSVRRDIVHVEQEDAVPLSSVRRTLN